MPRRTLLTVSIILLFVAVTDCTSGGGENWYKGNVHSHSIWSDGDAAPEHVADWYKSNGYQFLVLSEHDLIAEGERWFEISIDRRSTLNDERVEDLKTRFGEDWVIVREVDGQREMRLKTLDELRTRFEVPGEFILVKGEEISDSFERRPLHVSVLNLAEFIERKGGESRSSTMRNNLDAVLEQESRLGRPVVATVNHPNWTWALTPQELAAIEGTPFFEVYNGSAGCNNYGDESHPGMDEAWDIALTMRLTELGLGLTFGVATDDTHDYYTMGPTYSNPGRGWITVRARELTPNALMNAMKEGDFYSSTGVVLRDFRVSRSRYFVDIEEEEGVSYKTQFTGTRIFNGRTGQIGEILLETTQNPATYRFSGDELYVRVKIISSKAHENHVEGEEGPEVAWLQPAVPYKK